MLLLELATATAGVSEEHRSHLLLMWLVKRVYPTSVTRLGPPYRSPRTSKARNEKQRHRHSVMYAADGKSHYIPARVFLAKENRP
jgi:hypothetical protein